MRRSDGDYSSGGVADDGLGTNIYNLFVEFNGVQKDIEAS